MGWPCTGPVPICGAMSVSGASERIRAAAEAWPDVNTAPHRFGGIEFRIGRRELGHLHGDHLLDVPFPREVKTELIAAGKAQPHHVLPDSGWISFRIMAPEDVESAIGLLRRSYDLIAAQRSRRAEQNRAVAALKDG